MSHRFNLFYRNGNLRYIRAGHIKAQPSLCVASYKGGSCVKGGVLVTLKRGTNPHRVLYGLLNKNASAGGRIVELSNTVSTANGSTYLDMTKLMEDNNAVDDKKQCQGPVWDC